MAETTIEQITKAQEKLTAQSRSYAINEAYVKGKNPDILGKEPGKEPDNRIPIPLAKMAVEDLTGYAARPGDTTIRYESDSDKDNEAEKKKEDEYNLIIKSWMESNNDELELSEQYQKTLTHGNSFELFWTSESSEVSGIPIQPEWKRVDGNQIYIEYDNSLKPNKIAAYHIREIDEDTICDIYYPLYSEHWIKTKDTEWKHEEENDTEYPYTVVPVIEFVGNIDKDPLFEAEKRIIDSLDNIISKSLNEVDRFNAVIALFPGEITKETADKLKTMRVLDKLDGFDRWPEYLEKNLAGSNEFYNLLSDRLERLFHKSVKIPDMTDENFAGNQSGVAIAYKLIGMEFKASMIEIYFFQGIKERKILFDDILNTGSTKKLDTDQYKTVIESQRNLPVDEATKVQIAMMLKGLVTDETLLRFLPQSIIKDAEKELAKLEEQQKANPLIQIEDENDKPSEANNDE